MSSVYLVALVLVLLSPQEAGKYEELLARGLQLAEQKDWDGATEALRSASRVNPYSTEPLLALAHLYLARGEPRKALDPIDEALRVSSGDFEALFLRGSVLIELGMFEAAALELATALEKPHNEEEDEAGRKALALAALRGRDPGSAAKALAPLVETGQIRDPSAYAMYGASLVELGRAPEAIPALERALALEPEQMQAILYLGRALLASERFEEAAECFRKGVSLPPPQQVRYVLGLSEALIGQKQLETARGVLDDLLELHPRVARAYFLRGLIAAEDESYARAVEHFEKAIENGDREAEVYLNLGMARAAMGESRSALAALDEALERDPNLAGAYYYEGVIHFEEGDTWEAVELLRKAASLEPDEPRTFLALAEAHLKLGQLIQALEAAEKASESSKLGGRGHYTKGLVHHERVEYKEAEAEYRKAIALGFVPPHVHLNLARILYAMARHAEADEATDLVLEREPDNGEAHLLKGKIGVEVRQYDVAIEHLNRAAELLPDDAEVWFRKGVAHSRRGEEAAAISDWRKTLAIDPRMTDAYFRLGTALVKAGETEEGERILAEFQRRSRAAEAESHREAKLRTTVRRALELSGRRQDAEAQRLFLEALEIDPSAPLTYLALAEFYTLRGRAEEAEAILLQGISQAPDHVSLHESLLSLYEATGRDDQAREQRKRLAEIKGKS